MKKVIFNTISYYVKDGKLATQEKAITKLVPSSKTLNIEKQTLTENGIIVKDTYAKDFTFSADTVIQNIGDGLENLAQLADVDCNDFIDYVLNALDRVCMLDRPERG